MLEDKLDELIDCVEVEMTKAVDNQRMEYNKTDIYTMAIVSGYQYRLLVY